ncbi:MAG: ABC transporter substrate-binding protein [Defluviitaleaceae bacterium]|nr:ABC transporter substrate-binding protein [Defluviitaleaceae bacterium]MCL2837233.1 ABC transporter substrate-binding protein [Defluviitaleaceae bacterium]
MKRLLALILATALCLSALSGCLTQDTVTTDADGAIVLTIPHYKVGANVGARFFLPQVERFNELYAGVYRVEVMEVPNDMYQDQMRQLAIQNQLPPLVEGVPDEIFLLEYLIPNNRFYDLNQWLDNEPELRALLLDANIEHNTFDGKLLSVTYPVVRPATLYYNETLFQPSKPIGEMSWDELLEELGDNTLAFMTSENAWTTMIALTSMIAVQPGGPELLFNHLPDDNKFVEFTNPIFVNAITQLQRVIQTAGHGNTVGAAYADAANAFFSNNAAMIFNGPWMIGDFNADAADRWSNGFDGANVRSNAMPGNVGLDNPLGYGWWIPANTPPEAAEGAWAFISFMMSANELELYMLAEGGTAPNLDESAEFLAARAENALLHQYMGSINSETIVVPYLWNSAPGSIADIEFGRLLPLLIDGTLTPEEFCQQLETSARETMR